MFSCLSRPPVSLLVAVALSGTARGQQRTPAAGGGNYVIRTGDEIVISVVGEPEFKARISDDGTVSYRYLGKVPLVGKTVYGAEEQITALLKDEFILRPQVTVQVTDVKSASITVLGWVGRAGNLEYSPAEGLDIVKAIGLSGGFKPGAVESAVWVTRKGHTEKLKIERKAMAQFQLKPGDTMEVKRSVF